LTDARGSVQPFSRFAQYFAVVAQEGGLRRVAEKLHISASAIDRQILRVEEEFGVALFERHAHGLKLTSAGEFLLADLQRWRRDHAQTLERFAELQGLKRGHVVVAMIEAVSEG
jgi:DNA-binding transcriptional LysR family regulator